VLSEAVLVSRCALYPQAHRLTSTIHKILLLILAPFVTPPLPGDLSQNFFLNLRTSAQSADALLFFAALRLCARNPGYFSLRNPRMLFSFFYGS
jgi:hypothetical protein